MGSVPLGQTPDFREVTNDSSPTSAGSNFNRYFYAAANPYKFVDPDGRAIETPWDAANVAMGAASLSKNIATGNYVGAAVDLAGLAYDGLATAVPVLPGGAATVIGASRAGQLAANQLKGAVFEQATAQAAREAGETVVEQVTVKTASGTTTRLDLAMPQPNGAVKCQECKSSASAPLTKNQAKAFPEIATSGAVVVGKGKPGLPGGTIIKPTKVEIVRPHE